MQIEVTHPSFKVQRLAVETAGWFRGPRLLINGALAEKQKGHYSVSSDSGVPVSIELKYNFLDPVPKVKIGDELVELARPLTWHEYLWIGIPIILVVAGGALGAFFGVLAAYTSARIFRGGRSTSAKYGLTGLVSVAAFVAYLVLAVLIRQLIGVPQQ